MSVSELPKIFLPDGYYKIFNVKYDTQTADLLNGKLDGVVGGYHDNKYSQNMIWILENRGENKVTLTNVAVPQNFAEVDVVRKGQQVTGSANATIWTIHRAASGEFQIRTDYDNYCWKLPSNTNGTPIVLEADLGGDYATHWTFRSQ